MNLAKKTSYLPYPVKNQRSPVRSGGNVSGSETDVSSNENLSYEERYVIQHTYRQEPQGQEMKNIDEDPYCTMIIHDDSWSQRNYDDLPPVYKAPDLSFDPSVREITEIPDDYLNQSQVLKHLAKEVKVSGSKSSGIDSSGAESDTTGKHGSISSRKIARGKLSKSQPDLSALTLADRENTLLRHTLGNTRKDQQRCAQMVDHLLQENNSLKSELETCYQRVAKAHKLEEEVTKVTRAHEELVATCERKERLENARITRLQTEVRRLQEANRILRENTNVQHQLSGSTAAVDHTRGQLAKREALIAQLVQQNKELLQTKERQEIELAAQRATLQEQRTHIDILDTALINAQGNVVRLEEECRQKQVQAERVAQLQRALSSLQLASDRREQTERKLRLQLEQELKNERAKYNNNHSEATNSFDGNESDENISDLKRQLREKDEKIMRLEGDVAKWEQKYLEESQLRQAAIEAASIPKDAKIAALEKTSQETEKLIAEARSDRIRQMDEVHAAQKKITDLEAKLKELECKLAEKDAMIRVLQNKHTLDKEVSNSYPSMSLSTHHTPHQSINTTDLNLNLTSNDLGGVSGTSVFSSVSSALTNSTGFTTDTAYTAGSSIDSYHHKYSSPAQSYHQKSLDDQLKELDSQLLSKRGLCCFPGFSYPGTSTRKGKLPQPLLAGVTGFEAGGILQNLVAGAKQEQDIALLEKQGKTSQQSRISQQTQPGQAQTEQQRCSSLPPSSLPRPKRNKSVKERKVGEYGRLSDSENCTTVASNSSSSDMNDSRQRESPTIMVSNRKLGEYERLNDSENNDRKIGDRNRTSPIRIVNISPRNYARLDKKDNSNNDDQIQESSSSWGKVYYKRLSDESSTRPNSDSEQRSSPLKSIMISPRNNYSRLNEISSSENIGKSQGSIMMNQFDKDRRVLISRKDYSDEESGNRKTSRTPSNDDSIKSEPNNFLSSSLPKALHKQTSSENDVKMIPLANSKFVRYANMDETNSDTTKTLIPIPNFVTNNSNSKIPSRSFLSPSSRKISTDFFEQSQQIKTDNNSSAAKIRFIPTLQRHNSLNREQSSLSTQIQRSGGIRSLPTSNKYRIQF